jgi:hypothetical protein
VSERDAIIDKIKKLLRMKRGGTQGEIENALAMAAELARKHGIDLASIDPDAEEQKITHVSEILSSRMPAEAKFAAAILVNFFSVQVVLHRRPNPQRLWQWQYSVHLIGTAWDCEVSRYVFAFLQKHFRRAWSNRSNRRIKNRYAFLNGMFLGLAAKLEAEREAQVAQVNAAGLIVIGRAVELRKAYASKHWPNCEDAPLKKDDSSATEAHRAGVVAGQNTNIRKAVNSAPAPARPALPPATGQLTFL